MSNRPFYSHSADEGNTFKDSYSLMDSVGNETLIVIGLIGVVVLMLITMAFLHCWLRCLSSKDARQRRSSIRSTDIRYLTQIRTLQRRQAEVEKAINAGVKLQLDVVDEDFLIPTPSSRNTSPARPRSRSVSTPQNTEKLKNLKDELELYKINHGVNVRPALPLPNGGMLPRRRTWKGLPDDFADISYDEVPNGSIDLNDTFSSPELDFNQNDIPPPLPRHESTTPMSGRSSPPRREAFTPIRLPNVCEVSVQTTGTLERKFPPGTKIFQTSFETTV